ncbi:hypothetical protein M404DRAFT_24328 [Pisolithus tinctorius Marx 270]|uniref:Uncharacterized protein n=1 Tax=Pisolithus tinctorius Marx 270 TaxID=870435 RepID=A0A0C3PEF9_PISTI|nr:hypothetical protein M404DRAFT_24328 [Pisolithus tinctorius Marx 270]
MPEASHELYPLRSRRDSFVEIHASSPTLTEAGSAYDKVGRQRAWSVTDPRCICCALHVILVIIHVLLLVAHAFKLDQHIIVTLSLNSPEVASVGLATILQIFGTGSGILLVWLTQRLALRRDLLQRQTLTATHDKAAAWSGLGAALQTLWKQTKVKAATYDVFLVTLYLGAIAVFHVTSSSLLTLLPISGMTNVPVQYGMLNLTDLSLDSYWNGAAALVRTVAGFPEVPKIGLQNATLYETIVGETFVVGNATAGAVTFGAQCYSLSNVSATLNPTQNGSYTVSATHGSQPPVTYSPIYGLHENVAYAVHAYGKAVTILATPPILDASNNSGSIFNITQTRSTAGGSNVTETVSIQIMTCVLSKTHQVTTIDAFTSTLQSVDPVSPSPSSTWTPWLANSTGNPDPQLDWFGDAWNLSAVSSDFYGPTHCGEPECFLSFLDEQVLTLPTDEMIILTNGRYVQVLDGVSGLALLCYGSRSKHRSKHHPDALSYTV